MASGDGDVFDLFGDGSYTPSDTPTPWYPGARMDLDDYGRVLLHHLPTGHVNAIPAALLAAKLNLPWESTQYPLRHLIRNLVLQKGWPIATTQVNGGVGFYLLDSDTDADLYASYLNRRIKSITKLRDNVLEGWEHRQKSKANGQDWPKR